MCSSGAYDRAEVDGVEEDRRMARGLGLLQNSAAVADVGVGKFSLRFSASWVAAGR